MTRVVVVTALLALIAWLAIPAPESGPVAPGSRDVAAFLAGNDGATYATVRRGERLEFPRDHGAHPGYRQEWWYVTGNLADPDGRRFGFQLTFFRFAHGTFGEYAESAWSHAHSWMAHFAISDLQGRRLLAFQDYARGALGLAGAAARPFAVWVNGWSARGDAGPGRLAMALDAAVEEAAITLEVVADGPPLAQGEEGYSRKDAEGATASWYYSVPGMHASGELRLGDTTYRVSGRAWMDHEWSTEVLSRERAGWDWFALDLDDGAQLMLFQVRGGRPFRHAMLRTADGAVKQTETAIEMAPIRHWDSPLGGSRYPVGWKFDISEFGLELEVTASFDEQELLLDFRYWEGVVDVRGSREGRAVSGQGYMELTGY